MMSGAAIKLSGVGIRFNLDQMDSLRPGGTMRRGLSVLKSLILGSRPSDFWALRGIDLEIRRGEILGIIGGNGAGKSTLLKIMAGIYPVTEGRLEISGSIAPLIELGAAFNPELTGAENIFFVGSIYRIPRRVIRENFDRIVEFAGLAKFINTPIKNYSSGMFLRLAFSIVIFFRPDIVLIDEVFAVGDEVFQQKSFEKIISFKDSGAAIVLVTHDLNMTQQIAKRVLVLHRGRASFLGDAEEAIGHYRKLLASGEDLGSEEAGAPTEAGTAAAAAPLAPVSDSRRWGNRRVEITSVRFTDENGNAKVVFRPGDYFEARLAYLSRLGEGAETPVFGVAINTIYKLMIYGPNTLEGGFPGEFKKQGVVRFIIPELPLFEGDYLFSAACYEPTLSHAYDHHEMMYHFKVLTNGARQFGCVKIKSRWEEGR